MYREIVRHNERIALDYHLSFYIATYSVPLISIVFHRPDSRVRKFPLTPNKSNSVIFLK